MGHSTRRTSAAGQSGYAQAKEELNNIVQNKNAQKAADYGTQVFLASQPNGPAKIPVYTATKHGTRFVLKAQNDGVQSAATEVGVDIAKAETAGEISEGVVDQASQEISKRGTDVNKAMSDSSERALEKSLSLMMQEGGEALNDRGK